MHRLWDSNPTVSIHTDGIVRIVLELSDGSIVSSTKDRVVKRWKIPGNSDGGDGSGHRELKPNVQHVGTYSSLVFNVQCVVQKDDDTIITGGPEMRLWNITNCNSLLGVRMVCGIESMVITKDQSTVVMGLKDGEIEARRTSDLSLIWATTTTHKSSVICICELHDGSFVTTSFETHFSRWNLKDGQVLHRFTGHTDWIIQVVESKPNTIVSASKDLTVRIWNVSTQECLRTLNLPDISVLISVEAGMFATSSWRGNIRVWSDDEGELIEAIDTDYRIWTMTKLRDGSIVTAGGALIEIRKL